MREAGLVKEFHTIYAEYKSIGKEVYFLEDKIKIQHANSLLYMTQTSHFNKCLCILKIQ